MLRILKINCTREIQRTGIVKVHLKQMKISEINK